MSDAEIYHEVKIKASPAAVYDAITAPEKIAQWWLPADVDQIKVGETLRLGKNGFQEFLLTALEPSERVKWAATEHGIADWIGTEVEFRIVPQGDKTMVLFRHSKWRDDAGMRSHCSMSWAVFLLSLKDLLESGAGSPYPNRWVN